MWLRSKTFLLQLVSWCFDRGFAPNQISIAGAIVLIVSAIRLLVKSNVARG
jgi:hypothetical protein